MYLGACSSAFGAPVLVDRSRQDMSGLGGVMEEGEVWMRAERWGLVLPGRVVRYRV